jgi:hypothetical protein
MPAARDRRRLDVICRVIAAVAAASPSAPTENTSIATTISISVSPARCNRMWNTLARSLPHERIALDQAKSKGRKSKPATVETVAGLTLKELEGLSGAGDQTVRRRVARL